MAQTLTEVEVEQATDDTETPQTVAPAFEEAGQRSWKTFVLAPLTLLATGAVTFLVVRRWLHHDGRLI